MELFAGTGFLDGIQDPKLIVSGTSDFEVIFIPDRNYSHVVFKFSARNSVFETTAFIHSLNIIENPCETNDAIITGSNSMCDNKPTQLKIEPAGKAYRWSNNVTTQTFTPSYSSTTPRPSETYFAYVLDNVGCLKKTPPFTVDYKPSPPRPTISATTPTTVCEGTQVSMASTPAHAYSWHVSCLWGNPASPITGATSQTLNTTVNVSCFYYMQITAENGCSSMSNGISTTALPVAPSMISISGLSKLCTTGAKLDVCCSSDQSSSDTYLWSTGATTRAITIFQPGTYSVTANNKYGCSSSSSWTTSFGLPSATVSVLNPDFQVDQCNEIVISPTRIISPTTIISPHCNSTGITPGGNTTLVATANQAQVSYQWNLDGSPIPGATSSTYTPTQQGYYTVTVSEPHTCTFTGNGYQVNQCNGPFPYISGQPNICLNESVILTANSGTSAPANQYTYRWSTGATSQTAQISSAGTYTVTVKDKNTNCFASAAYTVVANPIITSFHGTAPVCPGNNYTYSVDVVGTGYTYQWTKPANWTVQSQSGNQITLYVPTYNALYGAVSVKVSRGNCMAQDGVTAYPCNSGVSSYSYSVSPNPANKEITVQTEQASEQPIPVYLYDQFGKKLKAAVLKSGQRQTTIETNGLASGFYLIQIGTEKPVQKKIVVAH
jgi:hypothetical protein